MWIAFLEGEGKGGCLLLEGEGVTLVTGEDNFSPSPSGRGIKGEGAFCHSGNRWSNQAVPSSTIFISSDMRP